MYVYIYVCLPRFYDNFMCTFVLSHASNLPLVSHSYWYCETINNISKENKQPSHMRSNMECDVQINSLHCGSVYR
jgi:hypothetical protein